MTNLKELAEGLKNSNVAEVKQLAEAYLDLVSSYEYLEGSVEELRAEVYNNCQGDC